MPKLVKNLIRPILVLLWSGKFRPKYDHWGASSGPCVPAGLFLKISQNSQQNACTKSYFNKVAGIEPAVLLKRDSVTGVFL